MGVSLNATYSIAGSSCVSQSNPVVKKRSLVKKITSILQALSICSRSTGANVSACIDEEKNIYHIVNRTTRAAYIFLKNSERFRSSTVLRNKNQIMYKINSECEDIKYRYAARSVEHQIAIRCQNHARFKCSEDTSTCYDIYQSAQTGAIQAVVQYFKETNQSEKAERFVRGFEHLENWDSIKSSIELF